MQKPVQTLVFIHGFLEDASMWKSLRALEGHFHCVYLNYPCHGDKISDDPSKCGSIQEIAKALFEEIDQLQISNYHCVGHSMGGYVGLELAQIDPKLHKLMLFHSNHWSDDKEKQRNRERVARVVEKNMSVFLNEAIPNLFMNPSEHRRAVEFLIANAKNLNPKAVANCSLAMKDRKDFSPWVNQNKMRVYFVQGDNDNVMSSTVSRQNWSGSAANYFEIKKCGHMGHIEQTEIIAKTMKKVFSPIP